MTLPAALPPVIPEPFAQNADPANINTIPATTGTPGLASYDLGFPPDTFQPVIAGGIPPEGQDFNGILFAITAQLYFLQSGQRWPFNATVAAAIGGYPVGAILAMADGTGEWMSTGVANSGNPDTGAPFWAPLNSYGSATVAVTAGAVTVPNSKAKYPVIVFTGVLTGNVAVTLPGYAKEWLLVNTTTGAFNLTAGAVGGGVSQTVPQGGYGSPLGVYGIGDGNLYPSVSPLGVPISIAPNPLTLVERDNSSNVFAQYYNSSAAVDNINIVNVFTDFGDGYLRKNSIANFESQLFLQNLAGAVVPGQVPVGAVTQYTPQILASANLTGTPVAPTQPAGTSNTTVATTAFVNPGSSLSGPNGYRVNPDGTIDQWGQVASNANAGNTVINYSIPFPTACRNVEITIIAPGGLGGAGSYQAFLLAAPGTSSFTWRSVSNASPATVIMWRAIGS